MISQKNFHIVCAPGIHSISKQNFSNQNITSFNPRNNHILLYIVDSQIDSAIQITSIFSITLSLPFCAYEISNLVWSNDFNQFHQFLDIILLSPCSVTPHLEHVLPTKNLGHISSNTKYGSHMFKIYNQIIEN